MEVTGGMNTLIHRKTRPMPEIGYPARMSATRTDLLWLFLCRKEREVLIALGKTPGKFWLSVGYKTAFFFLISPFLISAKRQANSILLF